MKKVIVFVGLFMSVSAWAGVQVQQGDSLVTFGSMTLTTNGGGVRFADNTVQTTAAGSGSFSGINASGNPLLANTATLVGGTNVSLSQSGSTITVNSTGGSGSITGVTAGVGLNGGGSSGNVTVNISTPLSLSNGGTGTNSPGLVNGQNVTISGSWPNQTVGVSGVLPVANGGTATASPGLIAGTNITSITGTWPNQTINAATQSGGGGSGFSGVNSSGNPVIITTATFIAGSNISLSQAGSTITINSSASGSGGVPIGTTTWTNNFGIGVSTLVATSSVTASAFVGSGSGGGSLVLPGAVSGTVTVKPQDVAGTWTMRLPNSAGSASQCLQTDGVSTTTWGTCGSGGSPGGSTTQVQFNNSGSFAGTADITVPSVGNVVISSMSATTVNASTSVLAVVTASTVTINKSLTVNNVSSFTVTGLTSMALTNGTFDLTTSTTSVGGFILQSKTLSQLAALVPIAVGQEYYLSNGTTDAVCIATQTVTATWARTSAKGTVCQ